MYGFITMKVVLRSGNIRDILLLHRENGVWLMSSLELESATRILVDQELVNDLQNVVDQQKEK